MKLDRIAFYGRTLAEYVRMFDLDLRRWKRARVLDCPSGPASFTAQAHRLGILAVACDPMFRRRLPALVAQGRRDVAHVAGRVHRVRTEFRWDYYRSIGDLKRARLRALELFAEDYAPGRREGRYVCGRLPRLPFADRAFDLVLSGHFLFGYDNLLDPDFHLAAVDELLRVSAREVRIYPIIGDDARPYARMGELFARLKARRIKARIVKVPFEFQKGADRMLRLSRSR